MQRARAGMAAAVALLAALVAGTATGAEERGRGWRGYAPRFEQPAAIAQRLRAALPDAELTRDDTLVGERAPGWRPLETTPEELKRKLGASRAVSGQRWLRGFNHVHGGDQGGWLTLESGERVQWMLRPGGLAAVLWPDGGVVYLVECRLLEEGCP